MKPFLHTRGSVSRYGGKPDDYIDIHQFIDQSKMAMPDMRHRAALHNAFGCFLVEQVFGVSRKNSEGREYSPRDVAEQHIIEDLGFLPSLEDFLDDLPMQVWHGGIHRLAKDQRPPTPAEVRAATRARVRETAQDRGIIFSGDAGDLRDEDIDALIAAVRGLEEDKD